MVSKTKKLSGSWVVLLVSLVVGGIAFFFANMYLTNKEASLRDQIFGEQGAKAQVVVATTDLAPGDVIGPEIMAVAELPAEHVSKYSITPEYFDAVQGHVLDEYMSKGEPLLSHFISDLAIDRFSDLLSEGERAITLEVDEIISNSHMAVAGDYVDIYLLLSVDASGPSGDETTSDKKTLLPLLSRVKIIAVDNNSLMTRNQAYSMPVSQEEAGYSNITIGVKAKDAAKLALAKESGLLYIFLRNAEDQKANSVDGIDTEFLYQTQAGGANSYKYYSSANASSGGIDPVHKYFTRVSRSLSTRELVKSVPVLKGSDSD